MRFHTQVYKILHLKLPRSALAENSHLSLWREKGGEIKCFCSVICTWSDCWEKWRLLLIRIPAVASVNDLSLSHLNGRRSDWRGKIIHSRWHFMLPQTTLRKKIVIQNALMTPWLLWCLWYCSFRCTIKTATFKQYSCSTMTVESKMYICN